MFDDLAATFYNNVVEAYDQYVAQRDSPSAGRDRHLQSAVTAATALYHFREHLPPHLALTAKNLEATSGDYALMRAIANATKHKTLTQKSPLIAKADDIREVTVLVRYSDEDGEYSHAQTIVQAICTDGTEKKVDPAITSVLNMWGTLLANEGVCGFSPRQAPDEPGGRFIPREQAKTNLNLEALKGLRFQQSMQLLRFDNDTGQAVPIDLTGANMTMRIFKPPAQTVVVTMSHPDRGEVTAEVAFSDEENVDFQLLDNDADRESFMQALVQAHKAEIEKFLSEKLIEQKIKGEAILKSTL